MKGKFTRPAFTACLISSIAVRGSSEWLDAKTVPTARAFFDHSGS